MITSLNPGALLQGNKYRILSSLGEGGFGITYLAEQISLSRKVAIKEFYMKEYCNRDGSTSHVSVPTDNAKTLVENYKQKFIKEAQMIASLNNPHIVRIYDIFEDNGTAYYVMEYLTNGSLLDKVKSNGPLAEDEAVHYINQIADALTYIHNKNILHLDVKPSNVLLDQDNNAVLIDFGISKHYDSEGGQTSTTPVGISKGFAPMEQYQQGSVNKFSPATDIYSLGATLFYLITGKIPPEAAEVYEEGLPAIEIRNKAIVDAISSAMAPKRKDRPQSVELFKSLINQSRTAPFTAPNQNIAIKNRSGKRLDKSEETTIIRPKPGTNTPIQDIPVKVIPTNGNVPKNKSKKSIVISSVVLAILAIFAIVFYNRKPSQDYYFIENATSYHCTINAEGELKHIDINTNIGASWTTSELPEWCEIHHGATTIGINCQKNPSSSPRSTTINFFKIGESDLLATLTINQEAGQPEAIKAKSISMQSEGVIEANNGEKFHLDYTISPSGAKNHKVSWYSSYPSVASVDANGVITALKDGNTTITARVDGVEAKCSIKVIIKKEAPKTNTNTTGSNTTSTSLGQTKTSSSSSKTNTTTSSSTTSAGSMRISSEAIGIKVGESYTLRAYNYGSKLEWESDNPKVATVDSRGVVRGVSVGQTNIWAKGGTQYKRCLVTVNSSSSYSSSSSTSYSTTSSYSSARTIYSKEATIKVGERVSAQLSEGMVERWEINSSSAQYVSTSTKANGTLTATKAGTVSVWGYINGSPKLFKFTIVGSDTYVPQDRAPYQVSSKEFTMYVGDVITAKISEGSVTRWEIETRNDDYVAADGNRLCAKKIGNVSVWGYVDDSPKRFVITIKSR